MAPGSDAGPGTGGLPLDIASVDVFDSSTVTPGGGATKLPPGLDGSRLRLGDTKKAGGGGRRRSVALLTATGVVALAAAPFMVVSPHFAGEPTSSTIKEDHKAAAKKPGPGGRTVAAPVPSWPAEDTPGSGGQRPSPWETPDGTQPSPPGLPPAVPDSPAPTLSPSPSPSTSPGSPPPNPVRSKDDQNSGSGKKPDSPARPTPMASTEATKTIRTPHSVTASEHRAKPKQSPNTEPGSPAQGQTRVIHDTYVLQPGQEVHTDRIRLALRTDGDLVLLDQHGTVVWSTGTNASGTHAVFQADGNFVLYSSSQETLWSTRTDGHDGAVLVMRGNGDLAIVQGDTTLWHTGTAK
ncbi:hypothetical protein [Actinoallomurus sp. CA-142502]|uniref:hypothetical protein n=1 Tax=Actinoallomurus sp. CA-142502 TaxID=3239885 RepID=UPI003D920009